MPELPLVGVTAIIAGMAAFNRDAAQVETSLLRIGRATEQLEEQTATSFGGAGSAFATMATAVATGAVIVTGGIALAAAGAVKLAADFQQSMAYVEAATSDGSQESKDQLTQLGSYITELSRSGVIGLNDLAEGALELGRSGVGIPEIMGGALKGVQELTEASGGEISLKSAADLVSNAMHSFGIEASHVEDITTAAAVVAQNSTATYTGFGQAVAIAGPSFKAAGFSLNDLAIATALITERGSTASVAATALRGVIQRLELPSKAAAAVMKEYGIHLFDASGQGVGLKAVLGQLHDAFGDQAVSSGKLTEEQRALALAQIGLQRTSVALFDLALGGTDAFNELNDSFSRLKTADLATLVITPLGSQMKIAENNVVALGASFGKELLPQLQATAAVMVSFLQDIKTADAIKFGDTIAAIGKVIFESFGAAITNVQSLLQEFGLTDVAGQLLKTTLVGMAVVILAVLVPPILASIAAFGTFALEIGIVATAVAVVADAMSNAATTVANWATDLGLGGRLFADALRVVADLGKSVAALLRGDFATAATFAGLAFHELGDGIREDGGRALDELGKHLDETGAAWAPWAAEAGGAGVVVNDALTGTHQVVEGLAFLLQGNFKAAAEDGRAALGSFGGALQPITDALGGALKAGLEWLANTAWPAIQIAAGVTIDFIKTKVLPTLGDVGTAILGDLMKAFDWLSTQGWPAVKEAAAGVMAFYDDHVKGVLNDLATLIQGAVKEAFNWMTETGFPAMKGAAAEVASEIKTGLIPALGDTLDALHNTGPAVDTFAHEQLPALLDVAGRVATELGNAGKALGDTGAFALKVLDPFGNLQKAWENLQEAGASLAHAFNEIGTSLDLVFGKGTGTAAAFGVIGAAGRLVGLALDSLILTFKIIAVAIEGVTSVIKFLSGAFDAFVSNSVPYTVAAVKKLSDIFGFLFGDDLDSKEKSFFSGLASGFAEFFVGVISAVVRFGAGIVDAFVGTFIDITSGFTQFVSSVQNGWQAYLADLADGAQYVIGGLLPALGDAFNATGAAISGTLSDIGGLIGGFFSAMGTAASAFANYLLQQFTEGLNNITAFVAPWVAAIGGFFTELFTTLTEPGDVFMAHAATQWHDLVTNIQGGLDAALAAVVAWGAGIVATIQGLAASAGAAAISIGDAIVSGFVQGIAARAGEVAQAAANLASNALQAARDAVGAHSPAQDFILLGDDMAEGVSIGLLRGIPKVKEAANTYGDSILQEMATFTASIETASRDIGDKLTDIATKAARSTADAIDKANHDIASVISSTQDSLDRLNGTLANPSSYVAQENAIRDLVATEKRAHDQQRDDTEAAFKHDQDLAQAEATYKKNIDLENSKFHQTIVKDDNAFDQAMATAQTASQRTEAAKRHDDAIAAAKVAHTDAVNNLGIRRKDDLDSATQRYNDSVASTARQRKLDDDERAYNKTEDAKITAFKEQEAIAQRDAKIDAINKGEDTSTAKIQQSADDQRALLLRSYTGKIDDLKDKLLDKIPPLTGAAAAALQDFMDNVENETAATTQSIVDSMGTSVTTSVNDVGDDASKVLGSGGVVPTAAKLTTDAFNTTTDATKDLRGDRATGFLGATDAATQISFVLQQLDEKMPHLVSGVNDLVAAINGLHDKTVTITTVHNDVYNNSGGGGGGGGSSSPADTGASGPGGIFDAARQAANNAANLTVASASPNGVQPGSPGGGKLLTFGAGGVVPGPFGAPMLAIVHGGEFVAAMHTEAAKWARDMSQAHTPINRNISYNVNASYANTQSPASVDMDMRAMVALSRGS